MTATIETLITGVDTSEIIGDRIAEILVDELANQVVLATAAGPPVDPLDYAANVYRERWRPWEQWLNNEDNARLPFVVNVTQISQHLDQSRSNNAQRQSFTGVYNLDIYAGGRAQADGTGQILADEDAKKQRSLAARLVRKSLSAPGHIYLRDAPPVGKKTREFVSGSRFPDFEFFPEAVEDLPAQSVKALRAAFEVDYNEFNPQSVGEVLELSSLDLCTKDPVTGLVKLAAEVDIPYPLP
jgi:hypothetical protein